MNEVYDFIMQKTHIWFLATTDGDQPQIRPFGFIDLYEGHIYLLTRKGKAVSDQMQKNPKIAMCAWDPKTATYLRVTCKAYLDTDPKAREHMYYANPACKKKYDLNEDIMQVFRLEDGTATFAVWGGDSHTVTFE